MTENTPGTPARDTLKELSAKYAAMLFIEPVNYILGAYVFYFLAGLISAAVTGSSAFDKSTSFGFTMTYIVNALASYTVPLAAAWLMFRENIRENRKMPAGDCYKRFPADIVILYITGLFFANSGSILTTYVSRLLNSLFGIPEPEMAFSGAMPTTAYTFAVMAVNSVIIAPICEELLYRHILLRPLKKYSDTAAVVVSSVLFSLSHFNFDQMLYTFFFGLFLGIIAVRSDSVLPAVICHMINNITAVLQSYLPDSFGSDAADSFFDALSSFVTNAAWAVYFAGIAAVILALVLRMLRLTNRCELSKGSQFAVICGSPAVIVGLVSSFAFTVLLLIA